MPNNPKKIPKTFLLRIFSLIIIADKTKTINGVQTIITAAEIGEVMLNPLKKESIFKATPKKAHAIIRGKSLVAIFSEIPIFKSRISTQTAQNKSTEPPTRNKIKP